MPLTNPNQDLKRDLKEAAAALEHADTLALMMLISGRKRAMTIVPTIKARNTIMIGSRSEVRLSTALSTSSS